MTYASGDPAQRLWTQYYAPNNLPFFDNNCIYSCTNNGANFKILRFRFDYYLKRLLSSSPSHY